MTITIQLRNVLMTVAMSAIVASSACGKSDPKLQGVKKLYVDGNNQTAVDVWRMLAKDKGACFDAVEKKDDADAVLEVDERMVNVVLVGQSTGSTARLVSKDGAVLWMNSEQSGTPFGTGAKMNATLLVKSLKRAAGCR